MRGVNQSLGRRSAGPLVRVSLGGQCGKEQHETHVVVTMNFSHYGMTSECM